MRKIVIILLLAIAFNSKGQTKNNSSEIEMNIDKYILIQSKISKLNKEKDSLEYIIVKSKIYKTLESVYKKNNSSQEVEIKGYDGNGVLVPGILTDQNILRGTYPLGNGIPGLY